MQAVIAIPDLDTLKKYERSQEFLLLDVAGVPLLVRVIATALRTGADSVLLLWPENIDDAIRAKCLTTPLLDGVKLDVIPLAFDPAQPASWEAIAGRLQESFLWLPWNWVTDKNSLKASPSSDVPPAKWNVPIFLAKETVLRSPRVRVLSRWNAPGVAVTSRKAVAKAERFLVAHSGKPSDGFYSKLNRWLCRWPVRILAHTRVTPNMVSIAGLLIAIWSAVLYSRGSYANYAAGAVLFFISGLIDDMDGMLARIKFRESAFGTWFEGFIDNATYLLLFLGITIGLYRQHGQRELIYGISLIVGCILAVVAVALQRRRATAPDRPNEYAARMNSLLEKDSTLVSRVVMEIQVFIRKGVAVHYVLIFTLLGLLPLFLRLAAIGANLTWSLTLYFTYRFFTKPAASTSVEDIPSAA